MNPAEYKLKVGLKYSNWSVYRCFGMTILL